MRSRSEKTSLQLKLADKVVSVPVHVFFEARGSLRAALGKEGLLFRMPLGMNDVQRKKAWDWFNNWAEQAFLQYPQAFHRLQPRVYKTGDYLTVGIRTYTLHIRLEARATHAANLLPEKIILLKLSANSSLTERSKSVKTLLSRVIGNDFYPEIHTRVHHINSQYFQSAIKGIYLKHLTSKWGSCSGQGNINLSTRLLFAPQEVIDYVIIHELAHLQEMNHSSRFWNIVERVMPTYTEKEQWLKHNNHLCDF